MPLIFFLILIILIATVGFWKTLGAIIGAAAMVVVLIFLAVLAIIIGGLWMMRR
ncbi:putative membrane protein [Amorphus suaedae]